MKVLIIINLNLRVININKFIVYVIDFNINYVNNYLIKINYFRILRTVSNMTLGGFIGYSAGNIILP